MTALPHAGQMPAKAMSTTSADPPAWAGTAGASIARDRFYCIQDAADYFRLVRQAMLSAQHTVFILGWDIFAARRPRCQAPPRRTRRRDSTNCSPFVARRRRHLRCYILIWDYAALYTLERDPFSRWKLGWRMPRRVKFGFDDHHPCRRLSPSEGHRRRRPARVLRRHRSDQPSLGHERASGRRARADVGRRALRAVPRGPGDGERAGLPRVSACWRAIAGGPLGEKRMPRLAPSTSDLWPADVTPDLTDVDVAISRTVPESRRSRRSASARRSSSIRLRQREATRSTSRASTSRTTRSADALAARLTEAGRARRSSSSRRRNATAGSSRTRWARFATRVFRRMIAADTHGRLRIVYPAASRAQNVPDLHPLQGDGRRRRARANRIGELLATVDGCGHGMRPRGRGWRRSARAGRAFGRFAIGWLRNTSACPWTPSRAASSERARSARSSIRERSADHTLARIEVASRTRDAAIRGAASGRRSRRTDPVGFAGRTSFRQSTGPHVGPSLFGSLSQSR